MEHLRTDVFTQAYIEAALWSSSDGDSDESLQDRGYTEQDITPEGRAVIHKDCERFQNEWPAAIAMDERQAGHDFWFTRNHHGVGFWDGDWPEVTGKLLTEAAQAYGTCDLYIGDDGKVHVSLRCFCQ
jgi:hypothetical protein